MARRVSHQKVTVSRSVNRMKKPFKKAASANDNGKDMTRRKPRHSKPGSMCL